jgi:hypothetical protein
VLDDYHDARSELFDEVAHEALDALPQGIVADHIGEAMERLETAGEVALRTRLILSVAPSYMAKGRGRSIDAWFERLPTEWVKTNGWLLYGQGMSCMGYAHSRPCALLELAYAHFARENDVQGLYLSCASALRAVVHEGTK